MRLLLAAGIYGATLLAAGACQLATGPGASPGASMPGASGGPSATSTAMPASTPVVPEASVPQPDMTPTTPGGTLPASVIDPIVADAAARTSVEPASVVIVTAQAVTWPDRGLGCPLPGVNYPQVPVDGYQVVVDAGGQRLDYRGSGVADFRLCTVTSSIQSVEGTFQRP